MGFQLDSVGCETECPLGSRFVASRDNGDEGSGRSALNGGETMEQIQLLAGVRFPIGPRDVGTASRRNCGSSRVGGRRGDEGERKR